MTGMADDAAPTADAPADAATLRALIEAGEIEAARDGARDALEAPGLGYATRGALLLVLASASNSSGRFKDGLRAAVSASDAFKASDDLAGECDALVSVAASLRGAADHAAAVATLEQAEQIARQLHEPLRLSRVLRQLGICGSLLGQHQQATSHLQEALSLLQPEVERTEWLTTRLSLYNALNRHGDALPADSALRQTLLHDVLPDWQRLALDCGSTHQRLALMARGNHAITLRQCGQYDEAIAELEELLPLYQAQGMKPNEGLCHAELGHCHHARGTLDAARHHLVQGVVLLDAGGALTDLHDALEAQSTVDERLGRDHAALAALRRVREIERRLNDDSARDALQRRELRMELAHLTSQWARQARQDPLTGLANRRGLTRWLGEHLPRVAEGERLTLLLLDLDHFKQINDRFGHDTGDIVLKRVAALLQQHCRSLDLAARYGGEEFVLALADADLAAAGDVAQRVRLAIEAEPWADTHPDLAVTVSIGVAAAHDAMDATALLTLADQRLYAAKYAGRNRVVIGEAVA